MYLFLAVLGLDYYSLDFPYRCGKWELLLAAMCGLIRVACLLQILDCFRMWASVTQQVGSGGFVVHRLSHSVACGIILDQGLNLCPLHWQAEFFTTGQPGGKLWLQS